ncbi:MAG: hypothetical protein N3F67_04050 [Acidilobaceae archaeon]|nr:hypothetical protein [Acidilobaceae archaeon]
MSSEHGDPRREAIRLLRVLSYHYSFRDLEKYLGISFQSLWRYATLNSVPEKETAEKILARAGSAKLIESIVESLLEKNEGEYHVLLRSPGFVSASAHLAMSLAREDLDAVVALSPEALSVATQIAMEREATICHILNEARLEKGGLLATHYRSRKERSLKSLIVPKECIEESSVAAVDVELDSDKVLALDYLVRKNRGKIVLAFFIVAESEEVRKLEDALMGAKIMVLKEEKRSP